MAERRPVSNEEATRYASGKCRTCLGTGWLRKWVYLDENHQERQEQVCRCAMRRFGSLMHDKIERDEQGRIFWKALDA